MKLICGNCYEEIKKIPDNSVDLIITDPPYEIVGLHNSKGVAENRPYLFQMRKSDLGKGVDTVILDEFVRVLKHIYIYIYGAIKSRFMIIWLISLKKKAVTLKCSSGTKQTCRLLQTVII